MKVHVHLVVSVPPRMSISELIGLLKGKTWTTQYGTVPHSPRIVRGFWRQTW